MRIEVAIGGSWDYAEVEAVAVDEEGQTHRHTMQVSNFGGDVEGWTTALAMAQERLRSEVSKWGPPKVTVRYYLDVREPVVVPKPILFDGAFPFHEAWDEFMVGHPRTGWVLAIAGWTVVLIGSLT